MKHDLVTTFPVDVEIEEKGETKTIEVEAWLCSCEAHGVGGEQGHQHHQIISLDPLVTREGIYAMSIMLYREVPMLDGRPYHGFVKRVRDRRKAWRKQAYREHLTR